MACKTALIRLLTHAWCCYREGWTAQQLFDRLIQDEFAQTGGLLPLSPRIQGGRATPPHLTAELFATSVIFLFSRNICTSHEQVHARI